MHSADSCSLPDRRGPASWLSDFRRGRWRRPADGGLHLALFGHLSAGFRGRYPRTAAFSCPRMSKNCLLLAGQYKRKKPLKSVAFYLYWTSLDYELVVQKRNRTHVRYPKQIAMDVVFVLVFGCLSKARINPREAWFGQTAFG